MLPGSYVLYDGKKTFVEAVNIDGTVNIKNPEWDWDDEVECLEYGITYDLPYWIKVPINIVCPI